MPSNPVTFLAQLFAEQWEPTVTGRSTDVPQPTIIEEGDESQTSLRTGGKISVVEGGEVDIEQLGFGVTHEGIDDTVTAEIRAYDRRVSGAFDSGRDLLEGVRPNATTPPDRHAGLVGEALRIIRSNRRGVAEYDRLEYSLDRSPDTAEGTGTHRIDINVACIRHADEIDTSV